MPRELYSEQDLREITDIALRRQQKSKDKYIHEDVLKTLVDLGVETQMAQEVLQDYKVKPEIDLKQIKSEGKREKEDKILRRIIDEEKNHLLSLGDMDIPSYDYLFDYSISWGGSISEREIMRNRMLWSRRLISTQFLSNLPKRLMQRFRESVIYGG